MWLVQGQKDFIAEMNLKPRLRRRLHLASRNGWVNLEEIRTDESLKFINKIDTQIDIDK